MLQVELKVLEGKQQGKLIPLNVRKFLIGREQDCQLRPTSDLVSRHHCVFTQDGFTVRLRDLGSTNGTFVNGERIQGQVVLQPGDQVQIGKLAFQVLIQETADAVQESATRSGGRDTNALSLDDLELKPESANSLSDSAILSKQETLAQQETQAAAGRTMEIPAMDFSPLASSETEVGMFTDDTAIIAPQAPASSPLGPATPQPLPSVPRAPQGPVPTVPPGYGTPPGGFPRQMSPPPQPGYGVPGYGVYPQQPSYPPVYTPQGYPQPYPPPAYPQGYNPMGGYPPPLAYPPPAYPPVGGYPQMPYGAPAAPPPPAPAVPESPSSVANKKGVPAPPVALPDPENTGAKAPEPKSEEAKPGEAAPPQKKPSSAAADIIRAHMQRRPGAG